ncbi:MAG: CPXCG motif-containing cysteine-rich protein [Verrucomicrobiota bacterium]|nr:CPXCG motif-containing cysteine-rich protein [Verrucomicrobiota bacterium]
MHLIVETEVSCTHCGELFPLNVDTSIAQQSFVEDCSVCCRPINLVIACRPGEVVAVSETE